MIGGQWLDITGTDDEVTLHKLKTGCLFAAAVGLALWAAGVPAAEQVPWRAFGDELGLLFQIVDDILDGDGYVERHGIDGARRLADEAADRARARLGEVDADTSVCAVDRRRPGRPHRVIAPSGEQYELVRDGERVVVVEVGGGLRAWDGVLLGYEAGELCRPRAGRCWRRGRTGSRRAATRSTGAQQLP